jgi:hypothetical protein
MRSTTRSCSSCCERLALLLALLLSPLHAPAPARADDWLAVLPPCSSARAEPQLAPRFEIAYPRAGLPALVAAGDRLIARAYVPSPLTPPPGVQQPRALDGWGAALIGRAAPDVHRYPLEVVDVRPDGASTLLYRAAIAIPAWVAPGTYDLELRAPGGDGRAQGAVRVLQAGAPPRVSWLDTPDRLVEPGNAALPVDVWVQSPSAPALARPLPTAPHPAAAPRLDPQLPALALRIGGALLVIGGCRSQPGAFEAEVAAVLAREHRTRIELPAPPQPGLREAWGLRARAWPAAGSLRVTRGADGSVQIDVAESFAEIAELALLIERDPGLPVQVSGAAAPPVFYPASEISGAAVPARVLQLRVAAGGGARVAPGPRPAADLGYVLHVLPQPAYSGARVQLALTRARGASAAAGLRVAWRFDALRTAFGPAQVEQRFLPLGQQRVHALALAADGRAQRVRGAVRVETARASGCSAAPGSRSAQSAGLWPALLLVQRRGRRKSRCAAGSGIDCGATRVPRGLT